MSELDLSSLNFLLPIYLYHNVGNYLYMSIAYCYCLLALPVFKSHSKFATQSPISELEIMQGNLNPHLWLLEVGIGRSFC